MTTKTAHDTATEIMSHLENAARLARELADYFCSLYGPDVGDYTQIRRVALEAEHGAKTVGYRERLLRELVNAGSELGGSLDEETIP